MAKDGINKLKKFSTKQRKMDKTQEQINEWEKINFDKITKWEKDFELSTITFFMADGSKIKFNIINQTKEG